MTFQNVKNPTFFSVRRKDLSHQKLSSEHQRKLGIPQHFGMYYAMGIALIMEGIMSGCYHVCPNHTNFQFDTAFMYTIRYSFKYFLVLNPSKTQK